MRLGDERESDNIEDRRGAGFTGGIPGGRVAVGGIGTVVIVLIGLLLGLNPSEILNLVEGGGPPAQVQAPSRQAAPAPARTVDNPFGGGSDAPAASDPQRRFVAQVLGATEDTWRRVFAENGRTYEEPTLVLFSGATQSACGFAEAAVGPFYCPRDRRLYLDMDFLGRLQTRLGAQGDFAAAYVIAHEVGHHVQTLLGVTRRADELRAQGRARGDDALDGQVSVRVELQADCFAGVWANRTQQARGILDRGDVEQGLNAAAAMGDDRLQMRARGYVVPESFTHGSSAQRVRWFRTGLESGDLRQCDTFGTDRL